MLNLKTHRARLIWKKIKRTTEWLFFASFDRIVLATQKYSPKKNEAAIVHIELLGDYVIWSTYGRALSNHLQSKGKNVTIIVGASLQPLAKIHFPGCTIIGIDRTAFVRNLSERSILLRKLRKLGVTIAYHASLPRDAIIGDATIRALGAPACGFDATFSDRTWLDCWMSRRLYTRQIPAMENTHQSVRHRAFLQHSGVPETYQHSLPEFAAEFYEPQKAPYFIIAPGASRSEKRWPTHNFAAVAQYIIKENPDWHCIVLGTKNEKALGETLAQELGFKVTNLAGATDLLSFVGWIANAKLVIGNDSAACHIAAACGAPSFSVVGGGDYGAFFPYPPSLPNVRHTPSTISTSMKCFGCKWICCHRVRKREPFPCIAEIQPDQVWKEVEKALTPDDRPSIEGTPNANPPTNS